MTGDHSAIGRDANRPIAYLVSDFLDAVEMRCLRVA
jgi:hypothetical protein